MNEEELNKEIYSNLKYKVAPDEQDKAFDAKLQALRAEHFGGQGAATADPHITRPEATAIALKAYLKWATGIAAVLLVGLFVWAPWNASLYDDYAINRTLSVAERGEGSEDILSHAAQEYNAKNYAAAKPLFAKVYADKPDDAMIGYYYAITLVETAEEDKGREILGRLYEGESVFKYEGAYYMALSYVKQDQKREALTWLDKIPSGTTHYDAAQELKRKLQ